MERSITISLSLAFTSWRLHTNLIIAHPMVSLLDVMMPYLRWSCEKKSPAGALVGRLHDLVVFATHFLLSRLGPLPVVGTLLSGVLVEERGPLLAPVPADPRTGLQQQVLVGTLRTPDVVILPGGVGKREEI